MRFEFESDYGSIVFGLVIDRGGVGIVFLFWSIRLDWSR